MLSKYGTEYARERYNIVDIVGDLGGI